MCQNVLNVAKLDWPTQTPFALLIHIFNGAGGLISDAVSKGPPCQYEKTRFVNFIIKQKVGHTWDINLKQRWLKMCLFAGIL